MHVGISVIRKCMSGQQRGHLLVDGYNTIHACADLHAIFCREAEAARNQLIEQVRLIHDVDGLCVSLVFDGDGRKIAVETPGNQSTFKVIFSSRSLTADGVIEQFVLNDNHPEHCVVITNDNMIRSSVRSAGAVAYNANYLLDWIRRCSQRQAQHIRQLRKRDQTVWQQSSPWDLLD